VFRFEEARVEARLPKIDFDQRIYSTSLI